MKKTFKFTDVSGEGWFSDNGPKLFSFYPENPESGKYPRYVKRGTAYRLSDGTFEFVENYWTRSRAMLIKKLSHGRLSKGINGDYILTIRIPEGEPSPGRIIYDDAMTATAALLNFIFGEDAA